MISRLRARFVGIVFVVALAVAVPALVALSVMRAPSDARATAEPIARALEDGEVSAAEFHDALVRLEACVEARGLEAEIVPGERRIPPSLRISVPDDDGQPDRTTVDAADSVLVDCQESAIGLLGDAWNARRMPTAAERQHLYRALQKCVDAGGVPGGVIPTSGVFVHYEDAPTFELEDPAIGVYRQCAREMEAQTGFLAPPPVGR